MFEVSRGPSRPSIWGVYRWEVTLAPGLPERSNTSVRRSGEANSHCSHTSLIGSSARPTRKGSSAPCGWRKWLAGPRQAPGGPPGPSPVHAGCPGPSRLSHSCSYHVLERIGALCISWKMWLTTGVLGPLPSQDLEQAHPSSAGRGTMSPPESILASTCLAPRDNPSLPGPAPLAEC